MTPHRFFGLLCAAAVAWLVHSQPARAQEPSAAATALGREILQLKGGIGLFDTVIEGVIEHHRRLLLQANPNLDQDLGTVSTQLRTEYAGRKSDIQTEVARAYASQFTEAELRQIAAFYKTPLGKKLIDAEPKAIDEATKRVDAWATKFADEVMAKMRGELRKKGHTQL
jgi:hypothetical protein